MNLQVSEASLSSLPMRPGVYIFRSKTNTALYIGKSKSIRNRVKQYFTLQSHLGSRTVQLLTETTHIDHIETETEFEALLLEADLIKKNHPAFNTQWKDDKQYLYIKIQNAHYRRSRGISKTLIEERWPGISVARRSDDPEALFFGPFPNGTTVRTVLRTLRHAFPWCKFTTPSMAKRAKRPCFYSHINLCPGICSDSCTLKEYWNTIDQLILLLESKKRTVLRYYEKKMKTASSQQKFEEAGSFRDTLSHITYITQHFHSAHEYAENINLKEDLRIQEIHALFQALKLPLPVNPLQVVIEGYDISNLGKLHTVGSQVVFTGGDPDKSRYRRYKINHKNLPDDFAAMHEMLTRRAKKLVGTKEQQYPDLLLIDGGHGQLSSARSALKEAKITIPIFGLAKKEETLIVLNDRTDGVVFEEIKLPLDSPARTLVQRIRDEAHRFAQRYHKLLRAKSLIS